MDYISSNSYWNQTSTPPSAFPKLDHNLQTDIVIIGGGIAGLTTALHLIEVGRRVVVLEAGRIGAGTTGGTSGHLDAVPDQGTEKFYRDHGDKVAKLVTRARIEAIDQIERWCGQFDIACDFHRVPAYLYSESDEGAKNLIQQHDTARELGLEVEGIAKLDLPFPTGGGLRFEMQARIDALRYVRGLAANLQKRGCAIYEHTRAMPPQDGEPCIVETDGGRVHALEVVLCTHSAFLGISELDMRIAAYQSYVITAELDEALPDALYWDDAEPYHYLRRANSDPRLVMIGGADHKTGQIEGECGAYSALESYARERFKVRSIKHRWSAEFFEPADGLPYIGKVPFSNNLFIATGFSGTGLTYGTVAGLVLTQSLLQAPSELAKALSPARLNPLAAAANLITENINSAKHFVIDRFGPESIDDLNAISKGKGKLVHYKGEPLAAFRDDDGTLHLMSPVCTHAGCYVQWNDAERTWDCPCHGGRYSCEGRRLYGPPPHDLSFVREEEL